MSKVRRTRSSRKRAAATSDTTPPPTPRLRTVTAPEPESTNGYGRPWSSLPHIGSSWIGPRRARVGAARLRQAERNVNPGGARPVGRRGHVSSGRALSRARTARQAAVWANTRAVRGTLGGRGRDAGLPRASIAGHVPDVVSAPPPCVPAHVRPILGVEIRSAAGFPAPCELPLGWVAHDPRQRMEARIDHHGPWDGTARQVLKSQKVIPARRSNGSGHGRGIDEFRPVGSA